MLVKELIEILKTKDPEMTVVHYGKCNKCSGYLQDIWDSNIYTKHVKKTENIMTIDYRTKDDEQEDYEKLTAKEFHDKYKNPSQTVLLV